MHPIFRWLLLLVNPLKSTQYFAVYYRILQALHCRADRLLSGLLASLALLLLLSTFHFIYLTLNTLNPLDCLLHFNILAKLVKTQLNLHAAWHLPMILYFLYHLFYKINYSLMSFLKCILLGSHNRRRCRFFLATKYNGIPIRTIIQQKYCYYATFFNLLVFSIDALIPYSYYHFASILFEYRAQIWHHFSFLQMLTSLLTFNLSATFCWTFFFALCHTQTLTFSTMMTLLAIFELKLQQIYRIMRCFIHCKTVNAKLYSHFRRQFLRTMSLFFAIDGQFGKLFLACLFVYCPCSIVDTMWIITGQIATGWLNVLFMLTFILYYTQFQFLLHYNLSRCTKTVERSSRLLLVLNANTDTQRSTLRYRLMLANDIQAWHTTNRYGFKYGNFGLVSLEAFFKYLLVYGKITLFAYKMVQCQII